MESRLFFPANQNRGNRHTLSASAHKLLEIELRSIRERITELEEELSPKSALHISEQKCA